MTDDDNEPSFLIPIRSGLEPMSDEEQERLRKGQQRIQRDLAPRLEELRRHRARALVAAQFYVVSS